MPHAECEKCSITWPTDNANPICPNCKSGQHASLIVEEIGGEDIDWGSVPGFIPTFSSPVAVGCAGDDSRNTCGEVDDCWLDDGHAGPHRVDSRE